MPVKKPVGYQRFFVLACTSTTPGQMRLRYQLEKGSGLYITDPNKTGKGVRLMICAILEEAPWSEKYRTESHKSH
jgi:hypothetical protein